MGGIHTLLRAGKLIKTEVERALQLVRLQLNGDIDTLPRFQNYGLASVVKSGDGLAAVVEINGHKFVVALDDPKSRPKDLAEGEVVVYHRNGDKLHFKNGNVVGLKTNTFNLDAATINLLGEVNISGLLNADANLTIEGKPFPLHGHINVKAGLDESGPVAP